MLHVHIPLLYALEVLYPVQALARILEIKALFKDILFLQPVKRIPDCSGRQIAFLCDIFLC